jgi:DNA ligase-1
VENIIRELQVTNSKNEKHEILEKHKDNKLFQEILKATYTKQITYGVGRSVLDADLDKGPYELTSNTWVHVHRLLTALSGGLSGGGAGNKVLEVLRAFRKDSQDIVRNILLRDQKCGISAKSINKVFGKNFIPAVPYMGCTPYSKKKVDNLFAKHDYLISQVKMDGLFCNAVNSNSGELSMQTRQGTEFGQNFIDYFKILEDCLSGLVFNGEFTIPGMDRQTSNGLINSYVKNPELPIVHNIVYTVWDILDINEYESGQSEVNYEYRLGAVQIELGNIQSNKIKLIESKYVRTVAEAHSHFAEMVKRGEEGTVLKAPDGEWVDKKPVWQIKFKPEEFYDLKIVGFNYGKKGTKNEHRISSLLVTDANECVTARAQGLKEGQMEDITANQDYYMGKVAIIKCNGLSSDRDGNYSLMSPVYTGLHESKSEPNTFEECKEIHEMNLGIDNLEK